MTINEMLNELNTFANTNTTIKVMDDVIAIAVNDFGGYNFFGEMVKKLDNAEKVNAMVEMLNSTCESKNSQCGETYSFENFDVTVWFTSYSAC